MTNEFSTVGVRTPADWERFGHQNVTVSSDGVALTSVPFLDGSSLGFAAADVDFTRAGDLYALTDTGDVSVYVRSAGETKSLSLIGYDKVGFEDPSVICTTERRAYVVDGESGLVGAFSRRRRRLEWTARAAVAPVAAVGGDEVGYVLDAGTGVGEGFLLALGPDDRTRVAVRGLVSPIDVSIDPDRSLTILDERADGPVLMHFDLRDMDVIEDDPVVRPLDPPTGHVPEAVAAYSTDSLVFGTRSEDDQSAILQYQPEDDSFEELPGFEPSCRALVGGSDRDGDRRVFYAITESESTVWLVEESHQYRKDPYTTRYEGSVVGRFDAGETDTQWHRLTLGVDQRGSGTRVEVRYFASDGDVEGVDDFERIPELSGPNAEALRAAGVTGLWELIEYEPADIQAVVSEASVDQIRAWIARAKEMLFEEFERRDDVVRVHDPSDVFLEEATGRYLHVSVNLVGTRRSSPQLHTMAAICPRRSYLRYLPEIYRTDGHESAFLERFLSLMETVLVDVETTIDDVTHFFDPYGIPGEYLSWLNTWLAVELGETWPESARRELLARSPELYRKRGTRKGMLTILALYFDHVDVPTETWDPALVKNNESVKELVTDGFLTIDEASQTVDQHRDALKHTQTDTVLLLEYSDLECITDPETKESYTRLLEHPRAFEVLLHPDVGDEHVRAVERMVESEKPAHTVGRTVSLRRKFQLGTNTYLGVNTSLATERLELGHAALGHESTLIE